MKTEFKKLLIKKPITEANLDRFDYIVEEQTHKYDLLDRLNLAILVTLILGVLIIIGLYFNK